jgi:hypothetical protein
MLVQASQPATDEFALLGREEQLTGLRTLQIGLGQICAREPGLRVNSTIVRDGV